jgi:hypothetical protein
MRLAASERRLSGLALAVSSISRSLGRACGDTEDDEEEDDDDDDVLSFKISVAE